MSGERPAAFDHVATGPHPRRSVRRAAWRARADQAEVLYGGAGGDPRVRFAPRRGRTRLPASLLELEVTEDCVLADERHALETFRKIQVLGVRLAFDDFGTGFASMSYLKKFPLDVLKIDKSFVIGLGTSERDMAIVSGMITLGQQLGLAVIAEGVEDRSSANLLMRLGCNEGQGYFYGRPMPAADFEKQFLSLQQPGLPAETASAA